MYTRANKTESGRRECCAQQVRNFMVFGYVNRSLLFCTRLQYSSLLFFLFFFLHGCHNNNNIHIHTCMDVYVYREENFPLFLCSLSMRRVILYGFLRLYTHLLLHFFLFFFLPRHHHIAWYHARTLMSM